MPRCTDYEVNIIHQLRLEGYTYQAIADKMGKSYKTIFKICNGETHTEIWAHYHLT